MLSSQSSSHGTELGQQELRLRDHQRKDAELLPLRVEGGSV